MSSLTPTPRTTLRRHPERGRFEREQVHAILDEALYCHVGFAAEGQPFVIPTVHARIGERLFLHGSAASRMLRTLGAGVPVCVTATLLDGLVLARSAYNHSLNYRSVVVLGRAVEVVDRAEKLAGLEAIVEHVLPGRSAAVRPPSERELKATTLLALPIEEASAKVRSGPPLDADEDLALGCWAGVLPLRLEALAPEPDQRLAPGVPVPGALLAYVRGAR